MKIEILLASLLILSATAMQTSKYFLIRLFGQRVAGKIAPQRAATAAFQNK